MKITVCGESLQELRRDAKQFSRAHPAMPQQSTLCRSLKNAHSIYRSVLDTRISLNSREKQAKATNAILLIKKELSTLNQSETTIIPFCSHNHMVALEFRKRASAIDVTVYNTGWGSENHKKAKKIGRTGHSYIFPITYREIPEYHIDSVVRQLVGLQVGAIDGNINNGFHKQMSQNALPEMYLLLKNNAQEEVRLPKTDDPRLPYRLQSFGTCRRDSVRAWFRQHCFRQTNGARWYREFNYSQLMTKCQKISANAIDLNLHKNDFIGTAPDFSNSEKAYINNTVQTVLKKRQAKLLNPSWPTFVSQYSVCSRIFRCIRNIVSKITNAFRTCFCGVSSLACEA